MGLVLSAEQEMLGEAARGFLSEKAPVAHLRALRDSRDPDGFSRALWREFAEMGFTGALVPEAHGGSGLGHVEAGVIMGELGRTLTPTPFLSTALVMVSALLRGGIEQQRADRLPGIAAGELIGALALEEGPKHAPERTALRAARSGNGFRLDGAKTFVLDGHVADLLLVAARTAGSPGERDGLTLFLLERGARGLTTEPSLLVDSRYAARLEFREVEVDADAVLGEIDGGWELLNGVLNVGRAAVAAELVGSAEEAFGRTAAYLKTRTQFGRAIGEFQALQHRAAHLHAEIEIAKAVTLGAAQRLDAEPETAGAIVSAAKAKAGAVATLAVQEAVQMHGGVGMTDALDIGFFMKRVRVADELFGDANFHADRLARLNGY